MASIKSHGAELVRMQAQHRGFYCLTIRQIAFYSDGEAQQRTITVEGDAYSISKTTKQEWSKLYPGKVNTKEEFISLWEKAGYTVI